MKSILLAGVLLLLPLMAFAHPPSLWESWEWEEETWLEAPKQDRPDSFRQLDELWPTPGATRLASGAPGPEYWQQRADYVIDVRLDPIAHRLEGRETITYFNESPHDLDYLWLQIDQNRMRSNSRGTLAGVAPDFSGSKSLGWLRGQQARRKFEGGAEILSVTLSNRQPLKHVIIDTVMRIDLPATLEAGDSIRFSIEWSSAIVPSHVMRARSGYEWFDETNNAIYEIAQWFPRMCPYTDGDGWQNKQFLGSSEFALEFGDYDVAITVPETFVVAASGTLENPKKVLSATQRARLDEARTAAKPLFVITPEEALANEAADQELTERGEKTWRFRAENVRDVAWAASPKFAWDAWGVEVPGTNGDRTMAMSYFPNEGEPLWSRYSTQAVAHTIEVYSDVAVPYPYPVAISVNGPVGGMEYPMICFNGPRPEEDGTYSLRTKKGLIGVIIHEVGHNWFPMIINSDERQWTWMDEGMNTFAQYLAQELWEDEYGSRRGEPQDIISYMIDEEQRPIMTHGESILQRGPNGYSKPATALNILRETILGRENFDFAFKEYCKRWAFKHPEPSDFFRTMDDASGVDLDWFWRAWFYSTDHVDVALEDIRSFTAESRDPAVRKAIRTAERDGERPSMSKERNAAIPKRTDRFPELLDFYNRFDELDVTPADRRSFKRFLADLDEEDQATLDALAAHPLTFTVARFRNLGGVVMPLPLELTFEDGKVERLTLPVEIWKRNPEVVSKMFVSESPIVKIELDPQRQIADADRTNNLFPPEIMAGRFGLTADSDRRNPMQRAQGEGGRRQLRSQATLIAAHLLERWDAQEGTTPVKVSSMLLEGVDDAVLHDHWSRAISVEFAGVDPGPSGLFATLRSSGADGERGTSDDFSIGIYADGSVRNSKRSKE